MSKIIHAFMRVYVYTRVYPRVIRGLIVFDGQSYHQALVQAYWGYKLS